MSETTTVTETGKKDKKKLRTSDIRSFDGLLSVGDSMRKMDAKEEAEEEGTLINDGDAPQFKNFLKGKSNTI